MTTLIIDRENGIVVSDSRGTIEKETLSLKLLPYPCVKRKKDKTHLTVQKIFEVNNHVIVGCGSLDVLELFVHKVKMHNFHFDNTYYYKFDHDVDSTNVYINKRTAGKVYTLTLKIEPVKLGFGWYKLKIEKEFPDKQYTVAGSGRHLATGAVEAGGSIIECIKIAAKHDNYTDDDIQMVTL
ncbi:peptidase HslV family [Vibrio phage PWH3a-P1]|uniref:peptidase HslV family n=1 Tax=Vibrio phage PWH3a-P1 TaxID=754058 RepID=UPI0002C0855F|nr:peptidase HslV family [Vibrio phage PWH3a-P1]AGH31993.1 hypothetical protein VPIG_00136 [Vibrio phage PWH3a-P1]